MRCGPAAAALAVLARPFTLSAARQALGTPRRVAVPLLELLDAAAVTERLPDSRRLLRPGAGGAGGAAGAAGAAGTEQP